MLTVLITGVAGLIGSNFSDWVIEHQKKITPEITVVGIDNLSGGYIDNIHKDVIFYNVDLQDYDKVEDIFKKYSINVIFHFAAYAAEGLSPFIRKFNYNNNLIVTTNLINMAIKYNINRFVFTSSMAVYGDKTPPFDEKDIPSPIDPYGVAKYACEMDLQIAGIQHNLDWCIIRPHNVFGKKQNIWDKYRNVLGIWMYQLLNQQKITIYGDGEQMRAFSYIENILEPLWKAGISTKASKQIINLGGINPITINDAASILIDIVGKGDKIYLEKRHEAKIAYSTYDKSVRILDYTDAITNKEGIKIMWEWVQKQKHREQFIWKEYELYDKLYSYWKT